MRGGGHGGGGVGGGGVMVRGTIDADPPLSFVGPNAIGVVVIDVVARGRRRGATPISRGGGGGGGGGGGDAVVGAVVVVDVASGKGGEDGRELALDR